MEAPSRREALDRSDGTVLISRPMRISYLGALALALVAGCGGSTKKAEEPSAEEPTPAASADMPAAPGGAASKDPEDKKADISACTGLEVDLVEHLGADQEPDRDEHHRGRDRCPRQPRGDRADDEQRQRQDGERPVHGFVRGRCGP